MNLAILKFIPWREIIDWTPAVVSMVSNIRKQPAPGTTFASGDLDTQVEELRLRVASIESLQRSQAEVFAKMAEQGEKLARVVQVLSARVTLLAWVAGVSLLISLVLAARELFA